MSTARERLAFAAGGGSALTALAFELGWYLHFDYVAPAEGPALVFWSLLMAPFVFAVVLVLGGALRGRLRFLVGFLLGAVMGVAWLAVAVHPFGLWLVWADTPIGMIWPLACAIGVAAAASHYGDAPKGERAGTPAVLGSLLVVALVAGLKGAPAQRTEALAFARGAEEIVPPPVAAAARRISGEAAGDLPPPLSSGAEDPPSRPRGGDPCEESARPTPPVHATVPDSSVVVRSVGRFVERRTPDGGEAGRTLRLWRAGSELLGTLTVHGRLPFERREAWLERVQHEPEGGRLSFEAFFADGFVSRFDGELRGGIVVGRFEVADAECRTRVLVRDSARLTDAAPAEGGGELTFRELLSRRPEAYRREASRMPGR